MLLRQIGASIALAAAADALRARPRGPGRAGRTRRPRPATRVFVVALAGAAIAAVALLALPRGEGVWRRRRARLRRPLPLPRRLPLRPPRSPASPRERGRRAQPRLPRVVGRETGRRDHRLRDGPSAVPGSPPAGAWRIGSRRARRPECLEDQVAAGCGSGRTNTVSATGMISSAGRSARSACSRIASGLDAS